MGWHSVWDFLPGEAKNHDMVLTVDNGVIGFGIYHGEHWWVKYPGDATFTEGGVKYWKPLPRAPSELKPCPNCGTAPIGEGRPIYNGNEFLPGGYWSYRVFCPNCGETTSEYPDKCGAMKLWNAKYSQNAVRFADYIAPEVVDD